VVKLDVLARSPVGLFILAVLLGLIPAAIAQSKGKSFGLWWFYGAMLFIVALPHALIMGTDRSALDAKARLDGMKKCPFCAEMIQGEARVCRYCSRDLHESESADREPSRPLFNRGSRGE
jgi:hypothetical protein